VLARLAGGRTGGEARHLAAALDQGDAAARQILRDTAEDLAFGLSHVVHLCHPQIIVIGGGLSGLGEPLRAAVAAALPRFIMEAFSPGPRLALAALGEDAVPTGALMLAQAAR
jgi:glucokinase